MEVKRIFFVRRGKLQRGNEMLSVSWRTKSSRMSRPLTHHVWWPSSEPFFFPCPRVVCVFVCVISDRSTRRRISMVLQSKGDWLDSGLWKLRRWRVWSDLCSPYVTIPPWDFRLVLLPWRATFGPQHLKEFSTRNVNVVKVNKGWDHCGRISVYHRLFHCWYGFHGTTSTILFFRALIDFIVQILGLIMKTFDNQTERWNPVSMIWLSSHLTLSFDNQW